MVNVVGEEPMQETTQMQVYVRRWRPSSCTVDRTMEVILDQNSPDHLRAKLAEISDLPPQDIQYAKVGVALQGVHVCSSIAEFCVCWLELQLNLRVTYDPWNESCDPLGMRVVSDPLGMRVVSDPLRMRVVSDPLGMRVVSDPLGMRVVSDPLGMRVVSDPLGMRVVSDPLGMRVVTP